MSTPPQTLPANFSGWDAPAAGAPPATLPKDFDKWDAPPPQKDFSARVGLRIGANVNGTGKLILQQLPDAISAAIANPDLPHSLSDVPERLAANLGKSFQAVHQLYKQYRDDPANLVGDIITMRAMGALGPEGDASSAGAAANTLKTAAKGAASSSAVPDAVGMFSPKLAKMMESVQAGNWKGLIPDRMERAISLFERVKGEGTTAAAAVPPEPAYVYPGAPLPEKPAPELLQGQALRTGGRPAPPSPSAGLGEIPVRAAAAAPPEPAPITPTPEGTGPSVPIDTLPRTLNGESALRDVLSRQDNANLLKIAKSRGINVTKESALKPGVGDKLLINKIADDFSPDELDEIRAQYIENHRFRHAFGDIPPEAWKTMALQTYFPDLKIPATQLARTQKAISAAPEITLPPGQSEGDLSPLLQESLKRARAAKAAQVNQ